MNGRLATELVALDLLAETDAELSPILVNVASGRLRTLADRTAAASHILASHGHWSDRAIASATGLSHKTDGAIRRRAGGDGPQSTTRVGRDGRARPVDAAHDRVRVAELLAERPEASLREIAKAAGVSPATVRDVRDRLRRGDDPVTPPLLVHDLRRDPSLRFSESGRALLRMLDACAMGSGGWNRIADHVPAHCAEIVAAAARECSRVWEDFAAELEQRQRRLPSR